MTIKYAREDTALEVTATVLDGNDRPTQPTTFRYRLSQLDGREVVLDWVDSAAPGGVATFTIPAGLLRVDSGCSMEYVLQLQSDYDTETERCTEDIRFTVIDKLGADI